MLFVYKKTGLNIQGINQKRFRVEVYPETLFLLNTEADAFIHLKIIPCRKGLI